MRFLVEAWELIPAREEAGPDKSRVGLWCKCDCCVPMTNIKESVFCPEDNVAAAAKKGQPTCSACGCTMCWSVCAWTRLSSVDVALTE